MDYSLAKRSGSNLLTPLLAPILASRAQSGAIAILTGFHLLSTLMGWNIFWRCPIYAAIGLPCPGCFLGKAISLFLSGHFIAALNLHLFAPLFLIGIILVGIAAFLSQSARLTLAGMVARLESRSGITAWILIGLIFYWGLRLLWIGFGP